jgi:hypothetical protein
VIKRRFFTKEEQLRLFQDYEDYAGRGEVVRLADSMGRTRQHLARHARKLGLTDKNRSKPFAVKNLPLVTSENHPRGMKGKHHSDAFKTQQSQRSFNRWHSMGKSEQIAITEKSHRSWKAGWRTVGGVRSYYRSRWEANYARYLEWLRERGEIQSWQHEPRTFWFLAVKRGIRSYLPDFLVVEKNGAERYYEVKGWMDAGSRTKLKRMAKYYPLVPLILIDARNYKSISKVACGLVPEWE